MTTYSARSTGYRSIESTISLPVKAGRVIYAGQIAALNSGYVVSDPEKQSDAAQKFYVLLGADNTAGADGDQRVLVRFQCQVTVLNSTTSAFKLRGQRDSACGAAIVDNNTVVNDAAERFIGQTTAVAVDSESGTVHSVSVQIIL